MPQIFDTYYSSPGYSIEKSIYGFLKHFQSQSDDYVFVNKIQSPTIILLHLDACSFIGRRTLLVVASHYNSSTGNKIVIDTSLESFIDDRFYDAVDVLIQRGVDPDDITVVTGENNINLFIKENNFPYNTININTFEISYYLHTLKHKIRNPKITDTHGTIIQPIKPRKLTKHFISYKKNSSKLRKIFHAHMKLTNLDNKGFYSWFATSPFIINNKIDLLILDVIKENEDWWGDLVPRLNRPIRPNSFEEPFESFEWLLSKNVVLGGGINLAHETHKPQMDDSLTIEEAEVNYSIFLTEKTYKNFAYGLPFINPGIPRSEEALNGYNYKTWDSFFNTQIKHDSYVSCITSSIQLIDEIANMPLLELEEILNSEKSLNYLQHNQDVFLQQNQFTKLVNELSKL
jgi:hypothetical protein